MSPAEDLSRTLGRARRRLMARRALESAAAVLPWSLGAVAVLAAADSLLGARNPLLLRPTDAAALAAACVLAPVLVAMAHGALGGRLGDLPLALLVDRGLGLQERATAAVSLRGEPDGEAWARSALDSIGDRDARSALPLRRVPWRASLFSAAALAGALFLPPWPARETPPGAAKNTAVVAAAATLQVEVRKAEEKLDEKGATEDARRVLEDVRKAAQRAQLQPMSRDEAVTELQRLDQQARREQEQRKAADAGALQRALSSIEQASVKRDAARKADEQEARGLEQQLASLAQEFSQGTSFEERDRKRMAARMEDAAEALRSSHPELAEKLDELADAIRKGDMAKAAEIAQDLAQSAQMQQLASEAATSEALDDARRMVRQAMASLGRAPTDAEMKEAREKAEAEAEGKDGEGKDGEGKDGKGKDGEGKDGKPGDAPGEGRDRSGKAVVATDWGTGTTNEAAAEFRARSRGQQADRQSSETTDWREAYEALHESTALDAAGRATRVRGRLGEGEIVAVESRQVSQAPEHASLPGVRVPESYARANEDAMAREEVPPAYKEGVRTYFTSLDAPSPATVPAPATPPPAPPPPKEIP